MNAIDFKDEEAVKEYIDRIGVEFRFQCFSEERTDGCHRLGDWLEFAKKDWTAAARIFKLNCDAYQYGHSCFKYGVYSFLGRGMKSPDKAVAARYYEQGCYSPDNPHPPACANLGLMINNGDHEVQEPLVEAKRHFERGCDLGDGDSCGNATVLWLKEGLKDPERAAHWAKKGCDLNDQRSCFLLSGLVRGGEGVANADESLADELAEKAKRIAAETTEDRANVTFGR